MSSTFIRKPDVWTKLHTGLVFAALAAWAVVLVELTIALGA